MRASALVLLALGGALAFSSAPADPRDSRTSYSGTLPPCADGNSFDCTDSPAMLIGGHSADAGDYSEVDTSLDGSYLDQGKRCVDGTWYQYSNCMTNGGMRNEGTRDAPIWSNPSPYEDEAFAACRVPCLAECIANDNTNQAFDAMVKGDNSACSEYADAINAADDILMDAFCAKHGASRKYKAPFLTPAAPRRRIHRARTPRTTPASSRERVSTIRARPPGYLPTHTQTNILTTLPSSDPPAAATPPCRASSCAWP